MLGDVDLIWSNCRSFNEADSEICDLADQAQQALRMRWQQEGLPTVAPLPPSAGKKQRKNGKKAVLEAGELRVTLFYNKDCMLAMLMAQQLGEEQSSGPGCCGAPHVGL